MTKDESRITFHALRLLTAPAIGLALFLLLAAGLGRAAPQSALGV